jgi:hypothetical protein
MPVVTVDALRAFLPVLLDFSKRYPNFYADISALTLPNRFRMLLHLRRHPEIHDRCSSDRLSVVGHACGCLGTSGVPYAWPLIRTTNRFDRQYAVCTALASRSSPLRPAGETAAVTVEDKLRIRPTAQPAR